MKSPQSWGLALTAVLFTGAGLVAGFLASAGSAPPSSSIDATDHAEGYTPRFPAATLKNFGITVDKVQPRTFFRTVSIAAVVVDTVNTVQPVFAPIGGRIESIDILPGTTIEPGHTLLTVVRDPLPRPSLTLTADVLRPAQEARHDNVFALRNAAQEAHIARTELARVEALTATVGDAEVHIIPRQYAIDLQYQLARAETAHEQATLELKKHGLTDAEIQDVERDGTLPPFDENSWKRALASNGLWPDAAEQLHKTLPESVRTMPWVTATVGELVASGLGTPELAEWIANTPEVAIQFLELGVLLQRGHTLQDLKRLHTLNALAPIVTIQAPPLPDGASWDVADVLVKPGAKITAGDPLVSLVDPRHLLLHSKPVGGEVRALLEASEQGYRFAARPLISGSGPDLADLRINYVESSQQNEGTVAFVDLRNEVLAELVRDDGSPSRTWKLRSGLRYLMQVPTDKLDDVFVLPASAVTEDGPNQIVFLQDGDDFRSVPVVIAYQDHEVAVIPMSAETALFPGDMVVQTGAFELGLAMKGSDTPDAHAGHNH